CCGAQGCKRRRLSRRRAAENLWPSLRRSELQKHRPGTTVVCDAHEAGSLVEPTCRIVGLDAEADCSMPFVTCDVHERVQEPAADSTAAALGGYGDRQFRYVGCDEAITGVVAWEEPEPGSPDPPIVFADHPGVAVPSPATHVPRHVRIG